MDPEFAFAFRGVDATVGRFQLRDISFSLPQGYVMGFVGANGAGKTTSIRCLLGMQRIERGEIEVLGHRVPTPVALRQEIGMVLDHTYLVGEWRLSEVERAVGPFYDRWDTTRYHDLLGEFGLDPRARVKDLSRGMAVKLMITIALSFVVTAGLGTPVALLLARQQHIAFSGHTVAMVVALSWAAFALTVSIQFPLFVRFGFTRAGLLATTLPIAIVALAATRMHMHFTPNATVLTLLAIGGAALLVASGVATTAVDPRRP